MKSRKAQTAMIVYDWKSWMTYMRFVKDAYSNPFCISDLH